MVNRIKKLCEKNKITIAKLEREMGFSKNSISKWEKQNPSYDKVIKVAKYFNITIGELVGEEVPENKEEQDLLKFYRNSTKEGKKNIYRIARIEYEEGKNIENEERKLS